MVCSARLCRRPGARRGLAGRSTHLCDLICDLPLVRCVGTPHDDDAVLACTRGGKGGESGQGMLQLAGSPPGGTGPAAGGGLGESRGRQRRRGALHSSYAAGRGTRVGRASGLHQDERGAAGALDAVQQARVHARVAQRPSQHRGVCIVAHLHSAAQVRARQAVRGRRAARLSPRRERWHRHRLLAAWTCRTAHLPNKEGRVAQFCCGGGLVGTLRRGWCAGSRAQLASSAARGADDRTARCSVALTLPPG